MEADHLLAGSTAQTPESKPQPQLGKKEEKKGNIVVLLTGIGTVLFLILSVWFYVGKEEERNQRLTAEKKLEQTLVAKRAVEQNLKEAMGNNEKLTVQVEDLSEQITGFKEAVARADEEKERLAKEAETLSAKIEDLSAIVESEKSEKLALAQELESLKTDYASAQDQLASLENEKKELEEQLKQAASIQATAPQQTEQSAVDLGRITVGAETPSVVTTSQPVSQISSADLPGKMGRILVVNDEFNFVVVSFGKNDGLKGGEILNIYRGGNSIGKVQVEKLYDAISAATILDGKTGVYQEGDTVRL